MQRWARYCCRRMLLCLTVHFTSPEGLDARVRKVCLLLAVSLLAWKCCISRECWYRQTDQGILKGEVSQYHWPPVWLVWNRMTTDNFCFYLQNRLIQTSQTEGQWYSDTSPFSIPWTDRKTDRKTWRQILMKGSGSKACLMLAGNVSSSESVPTDRQTET